MERGSKKEGERYLSGRNRTVTVTFSLDLAKSGRSGGWAEGGLTGETEEGFERCAGRAAVDDGVVGRADSIEEGVVGREEEEEDEGVMGRAPGLGAGGVEAFLDRNGEMLDLTDLDDISDPIQELGEAFPFLLLSLSFLGFSREDGDRRRRARWTKRSPVGHMISAA